MDGALLYTLCALLAGLAVKISAPDVWAYAGLAVRLAVGVPACLAVLSIWVIHSHTSSVGHVPVRCACTNRWAPLDDRWRELAARIGRLYEICRGAPTTPRPLGEIGANLFGGSGERDSEGELPITISAVFCAAADLLAWFLGWQRGRAPLDDLWLGAESANYAAHGCVRSRDELVAAYRPRGAQQETEVRLERICPTLFAESPSIYVLALHRGRGGAILAAVPDPVVAAAAAAVAAPAAASDPVLATASFGPAAAV